MPAVLITSAVFFGVGSVIAGGGFATAIGLLCAILLARFLLFAIAIKLALLEPMDMTLRAPVATAAVMALGFAGLLAATVIEKMLPHPRNAAFPAPKTGLDFLSLAIVIAAWGGIGFVLNGSGDDIRTGEISGITHAISSIQSFAVVPVMFFAWAKGGKRFLSHPAVLLALAFSVFTGTLSTGKQAAMEPLVFFAAVGFLRHGLASKTVWAFTGFAVVFYSTILYPYSQYVRSNGGREPHLTTRTANAVDVLTRMLTDSTYRQTANESVRHGTASFLNHPELSPFDRLAMIGEADRLIDATNYQQSFTGWETIAWGFRLAMPSFLDRGKPLWGTGNYLAHIAQDVGNQDGTTQVAYGIMANFYNAFGYVGVIAGSTVFFTLFIYIIRFWFGAERISRSCSGKNIWPLLIVAKYHHSIVELSVANMIPEMSFPLIVLFLIALAGVLRLIITSPSRPTVHPVWRNSAAVARETLCRNS